ncbi:hypothetical protein EV421DRAFT_1903459 [Armillaria borealis]|uniref:Uncharacterized protein n=1 Tax=Armillaria borealis TaxID=47425 RepID=A0AA39MS67_9AGAR|nr:hypothetical protein EV421DRAFT_1903459 [Armillaria borealis]
MDDHDDKNVWGLPPRLKRIPQTNFSGPMRRALKEHLDTYVRAIECEETANFWEWFLYMWVRWFPECVTNSWAKEYQASVQECYHRLENQLDRMGGQDAKNELAMHQFMFSIPEETSDSSASSRSSEESSNEGTLSGTEESSSDHSMSILARADDGHDVMSTDAKQGARTKRVGLELRMRAKTRLLYWRAALPTGTDHNPAEWERLDVDAWVAATGYDELDVQVPVTSMTVGEVTTIYEM